MTKEIWDVIIIGAGPAGLTAAIYGARARIKTLLLEKKKIGGQAAATKELENFPGFGRGSTGPGTMKALKEHAEDFGAVVLIGEEVIDMYLDLEKEIKIIRTKKAEEYYAKTVILATGINPRSLGIKGEVEYMGRGISFCTTCDAEIYEDLDVVLVGDGEVAIEQAIFLTKFAASVTMIIRNEEGVLNASKGSRERLFANTKMRYIWNTVIEEIKGDDGLVSSVILKNLKTGEVYEKKTDGVFFFVGYVPNTELLKGKVDLDSNGYIIVNEKMETSVRGVYAAGDANRKHFRQVVTAAADGAVAAFEAEKYVAKQEKL